MTISQDIFAKAMSLRAGQKMLVPCHNTRQQESLRVSLAWQRRSFHDTSAGFDILTSKRTKNGKPFLQLEKVPRNETVLVVDEDGSSTVESIRANPLSEITDMGLNYSRIKRAMEEDGKTQEEIDAYFSSEEVSKIDTSLDECELNPEALDNE